MQNVGVSPSHLWSPYVQHTVPRVLCDVQVLSMCDSQLPYSTMDGDSSVQNENLTTTSLSELEGNFETSLVNSQDTMRLDAYPFLLPHEDNSMARKGFAQCTICRAKVKWRRINAVQEHLINSKHTQVNAEIRILKYFFLIRNPNYRSGSGRPIKHGSGRIWIRIVGGHFCGLWKNMVSNRYRYRSKSQFYKVLNLFPWNRLLFLKL